MYYGNSYNRVPISEEHQEILKKKQGLFYQVLISGQRGHLNFFLVYNTIFQFVKA